MHRWNSAHSRTTACEGWNVGACIIARMNRATSSAQARLHMAHRFDYGGVQKKAAATEVLLKGAAEAREEMEELKVCN